MPAMRTAGAPLPVWLLNPPFMGTLEPSWSLDRLFPTADTPERGYPTSLPLLWHQNRARAAPTYRLLFFSLLFGLSKTSRHPPRHSRR